MIILSLTTSLIQAKLAAAGTAVKFHGVYADVTSVGAFTPGTIESDSNGTTYVDVVPAPAASTQRQVKNLYAYNGDSVPHTITVMFNANGTLRGIVIVTLGAGASVDLFAIQMATGAMPGVTNVWTAAQTFQGNDTHAGAETFNGAVTFNGGIGGVQFGMRNRIINSNIAIDKRNAGAAQTFTAAAALAYCVDRFYAWCTGANVTGQQVSVSGLNRYRFTGAASVTQVGFAQRIEALNCRDMAGGTCNAQVKLASSSLTSIGWALYYANTTDTFGSLASPSRTAIATGTFTITDVEATYYTGSITLPAGAYTGLELVLTGGALLGTKTLTIGDVQLESGPVPSPFEFSSIAMEELRCGRYLPEFNASAATDYVATGIILSTSYAEFVLPFKVPPRVPPTAIVISAAADFGVYDAAASSTATAFVFNAANRHGVRVRVTGTATPYTAGRAAQLFVNSATAKLYFTGSEL